MASKDALLTLLARHIGEANGISAEGIAAALGITEREVRALVTKLRLDGTAVGALPDTGYYIALTPAELDRTCERLHRRAMKSLTLISKLRNVPMQDLLGQLHLKT